LSDAAGSNQIIPGQHMTFSSRPGVLTSGDDFYVISSSLVCPVYSFFLYTVSCE